MQHGPAASSGSNPKAPGSAGATYCSDIFLRQAPRNSVPRIQPNSEKWEMAPPDVRLQINPYTGEWHYPRQCGNYRAESGDLREMPQYGIRSLVM